MDTDNEEQQAVDKTYQKQITRDCDVKFYTGFRNTAIFFGF